MKIKYVMEMFNLAGQYISNPIKDIIKKLEDAREKYSNEDLRKINEAIKILGAIK